MRLHEEHGPKTVSEDDPIVLIFVITRKVNRLPTFVHKNCIIAILEAPIECIL